MPQRRRDLYMKYTRGYILSVTAALLVLIPMAVLASPETKGISESVQGQLMAQAHRSCVTALVLASRNIPETLDKVNANIEQIRAIVKIEQAEEAFTTDAIEKLSSRGSLVYFFFGQDRHSLDLLKAQSARTKLNVEQLQTLIGTMKKSDSRQALTIAVQALEDDDRVLQDFVLTHDTKDSWLHTIFTSKDS
ncbi:MAG: hypothetical protein JWN18_15 [Parcubacteria group bacterium]|nr:hypothetical protein [Parcubacteria group bacterium]